MNTAENKQDNQDNNQILPKTATQFEKLMKGIFGKSYDIIIDKFQTYKGEAVIVYVDGLTNKDLLDRDILHPLKSKNFEGNIDLIIKSSFSNVSDIPQAISKVLDGNVILFYDNIKTIYIIELKQWDKRSVEAPESETVTRGPKEGYTENIITNTALIRRKLRTPNLIIENMKIGRQTNTNIALVYLNDIVNNKVLEEVKKKLAKINVDSILESGHLEQYLEEKPFNPISGMGLTQKPDVTAAKILEGRVAILCDGTPHVLIIPELFIENLHTSEDYYSRTIYVNFLRMLRIFALIISILLPGVAVAILTFSPEMLPFVFLRSFMAATEKTPLPEAIELFFLILMFELLKEGGTRLPKTIGSAITIVGALVIGQAAVDAGIVGAPSVIIVALTSVSSLLIPNLTEFTTIYRFLFLFLGATMGLIGIGAGIIIMLINLISTDSFGIPILSSFNKEEMKDNFIRFPLTAMKYRPRSIVKNNLRRSNFDYKGDDNE